MKHLLIRDDDWCCCCGEPGKALLEKLITDCTGKWGDISPAYVCAQREGRLTSDPAVRAAVLAMVPKEPRVLLSDVALSVLPPLP